MKTEQILISHLYNTKQITLQGIGTFRLDPSFSFPENSDANIVFPNDAITFEYNPKAIEDASLIDAIVQHTKKIKPLATSDLDSFIMAGKELMMLNNPFILNGIGSITKTQNGIFNFAPEQLTPPKIQKAKSVTKNKPGAGSIKNYSAVLSKIKKPLVIIVVISFISLTVFSLVNFIMNKRSDKKSAEQTQKLPVDQTDTLKPANSTKTDELINTSKAPDANKYTFKIVFFETTNHGEALIKLNEIIGFGHSPVMYNSGSVYKVAMPFSLPLTDTLHIKDSLDQFYSLGKGFVEVE